MPNREKKNERLAGLFVLIGCLMLGGLIVQFGRFGDRFKGHYELLIEFPDTAGIIKDSEVRLRGAKVGKVAMPPELVMNGKESFVRMTMSIRDEVKIPDGSAFQISSSGFIGDKFIEIIPPDSESGKFYTAGETIQGDSRDDLDAIKESAQSIAAETRDLLKDVKVTMEKMNTGLDSIKQLSENIDTTVSRVNNDFLSADNAKSISLTLQNFQDSSANIKDASGEFKPFILEAKQALAHIQTSTDQALGNIPSAVKSIDRAAVKAEETMDALQNKNSLAGTLTQDEQAGSNAKEFLKNLKRYGILRYRDDQSPEDNDPRNKFRGSRR